ncbi:hypothetical protein FG05_13907 [Fusarium graminearum]|nr:hypothetical protein FG05_13907 [Fusarium graminearum]
MHRGLDVWLGIQSSVAPINPSAERNTSRQILLAKRHQRPTDIAKNIPVRFSVNGNGRHPMASTTILCFYMIKTDEQIRGRKRSHDEICVVGNGNVCNSVEEF